MGRTSHSPGQWCTVTVQQREYTDRFGSQRIEILRLDVYGPGPTTCSHAAELATIAGSRLGAV